MRDDSLSFRAAMAQYVSRDKLDEAHEDQIWCAAWSSDGKLVTGSCDETVRTWTVNGQQIEKKSEMKGHSLGVNSVSISRDAKVLATSAIDSFIRLWDLERDVLINTIDAMPVQAWAVSCSPDGSTVASGSWSGDVNLWSVSTGKKLGSIETGSTFAMSVAWSPCGRYIASGSEDGHVTILDAAAQKVLHSHKGHAKAVRTVAFSKVGGPPPLSTSALSLCPQPSLSTSALNVCSHPPALTPQLTVQPAQLLLRLTAGVCASASSRTAPVS